MLSVAADKHRITTGLLYSADYFSKSTQSHGRLGISYFLGESTCIGTLVITSHDMAIGMLMMLRLFLITLTAPKQTEMKHEHAL